MSKNLIRKGLAIGTALSFALAGLSAAPASADNAGLVTLMPSAGTTFNSLSGAHGIKLKATVDADISDATSKKLTFLVTNASRAALTLDVGRTDFSAATDTTVRSLSNGVLSADEADQNLNSSTIVVNTTLDVAERTQYLQIKSAKEATITVQSFVDKDEDGVVDAGEAASKAETVVLYDAANVVVNVAVDPSLITGVTSTVLRATFAKSVNVDQIDKSFYGFAFYKDGVNQDLVSNAVDRSSESSTDYTLSADIVRFNGAASDSVGRLQVTTTAFTAVVAGSNYSARVAYLGVTGAAKNSAVTDYTKVVWAGNRSSAQYVIDATDTTVTGLEWSVADTKNTKTNTDVTGVTVRAGVKDVKYTIQALKDADGSGTSADADYESSNVRVKATLTGTTVGTGAKLTISGSTDVITTDAGTIAVYGRTDAKGQFSVTVSNSGAATGSKYALDIDYLDATTDKYVDTQTTDLAEAAYEAATISSFKAVNKILAGSTVNADFKVLDQFSQPISVDSEGSPLSVYLADTDTTKLKKTAAVVNGKATISFTNYLSKGDSSALTTKLFYGSTYGTDVLVTATTTDADVTLYNPEATGSIIVNATEEAVITYSPFVLGDPTTDTDADTVVPDTNDKLAFKGRVEDANGAGLPGAVVTVSGKGLQFEDTSAANEFTKDSITVVADASGDFTVNIWNHKVGKTTITVASGGKSATSVLTGLFNTSATGLNTTTSGTDRVVLKWNVQKHPAVNGTYVLTSTVADKWGNALKGATVEFTVDGALTVNGQQDPKRRTSSATGKATVYLGTLKDAKGFGSVSATIVSVQVDRNADNDVADTGDIATVAIGSEENLDLTAELVVGPDATAAASKTAGLVKVTAYNASGKSVQVYVDGKLVATKKATSASYSFNVKAKKGDKKVTVKVSGSTFYTDVITVK